MLNAKYGIVDADGTFLLENKETGKTIPVDEPTFILRAKDKFALPLLEVYRGALERHYGTEVAEQFEADVIEPFRTFLVTQTEKMKYPD